MNDQSFSGKGEKFLFHMNVFEDELLEDEVQDEEPEEDLPPPPPVFTLEELEEAKASSYAEGYNQGKKDEQDSREEKLARIQTSLSQDIKALFDAEEDRHATFEREVLCLSHSIFEQLFPLYTDSYGLTELQNQIQTILQTHYSKDVIKLCIHSDFADDITQFIATLSPQDTPLNIQVVADDSCATGQFKMQWPYGGAKYDSTIIAEQIRANIQEMLATSPAKSHDSSEGLENKNDIPSETVPTKDISIAKDDDNE